MARALSKEIIRYRFKWRVIDIQQVEDSKCI